MALVLLILGTSLWTARENLLKQGLVSGFGFLNASTGWDVAFSLIPFSPDDSYLRVLIVGLLNTVLVGTLGILVSAVFGTVLALARISKNFVLKALGTAYVELFRDIPPILQVFFWYAVLTHLPPPRHAIVIFHSILLCSRGLFLPSFNISWPYLVGALLLILSSGIFTLWSFRPAARERWGGARERRWLRLVVLATACIGGISLLYAGRHPHTGLLSVPELRGLAFVGGLQITPELTALVLAIAAFGTAYVGEIVRAGFLGVNRGQMEAAAALGLSPFAVFWNVRLPLALRICLPPLSSQFIWLMKSTSFGIAIGFSDFFSIVSTSITQEGHAIPLLLLLMAGFLLINYLIAATMNLLNRSLQKEASRHH